MPSDEVDATGTLPPSGDVPHTLSPVPPAASKSGQEAFGNNIIEAISSKVESNDSDQHVKSGESGKKEKGHNKSSSEEEKKAPLSLGSDIDYEARILEGEKPSTFACRPKPETALLSESPQHLPSTVLDHGINGGDFLSRTRTAISLSEIFGPSTSPDAEILESISSLAGQSNLSLNERELCHLQDYMIQLLLLEQPKKKRKMMAHQEQNREDRISLLDYNRQLMLLEEQEEKRKWMARQQQEQEEAQKGIDGHPKEPSSGTISKLQSKL